MSIQRVYDDANNGMMWSDLEACLKVAQERNEVITFRSTGRWSLRWIEAGFPTKTFHVKGKSSDWGPQAGLIPRLGIYSKVGHDPTKAAVSDNHNLHGIHGGYAATTPLILTAEQLHRQISEPVDGRTAIQKAVQLDTGGMLLKAMRPGDKKMFDFLAMKRDGGKYQIYDFPDGLLSAPKEGPAARSTELEVMTTMEAGTDLPMTGDYDLFNICPRFENFGSTLGKSVSFAGFQMKGKSGMTGAQEFQAGTGMDRAMDMRIVTTTGKKSYLDQMKAYGAKVEKYTQQIQELESSDKFEDKFKQAGIKQQLDALKGQIKTLTDIAAKTDKAATKLGNEADPRHAATWLEHKDMGNMTPRILACIMDLNNAMGAIGDKFVFRRVHHNAESDRAEIFGAVKRGEMEGDKPEALPITVFSPKPIGRWDTIDLITTLPDLEQYFAAVFQAGWYVPKNRVWGMSSALQQLMQRNRSL